MRKDKRDNVFFKPGSNGISPSWAISKQVWIGALPFKPSLCLSSSTRDERMSIEKSSEGTKLSSGLSPGFSTMSRDGTGASVVVDTAVGLVNPRTSLVVVSVVDVVVDVV